MKTNLKCIMLVDDNPDDNYFHERAIKQTDLNTFVIKKNTAQEGLLHLRLREGNKCPHPDLIFLDINMPGMNGWEFLKEYNLLDKAVQSKVVIIMLTTSENEEDIEKAHSCFVSDFITKPLTREKMMLVSEKYFTL
jgi:CheY-like chemotaxis protein